MLNTKYFIVGEEKVQENSEANGSAWFVNNLMVVNSANDEIQGLDSLKTKKEAVIRDDSFKKLGLSNKEFKKDSTAVINLIDRDVIYLKYKTTSDIEQFAVFSEIYYKHGWNAYLDGKLVPHERVNYVLRGMIIPSGEHIVEFKFEPTVIRTGSIISLISYAFMIIIPIGFVAVNRRRQKE